MSLPSDHVRWRPRSVVRRSRGASLSKLDGTKVLSSGFGSERRGAKAR